MKSERILHVSKCGNKKVWAAKAGVTGSEKLATVSLNSLLPANVCSAVFFAGLCEAEPVSGVVLEHGFNAVRTFGWFGNELHALAL
jgi:hypothetical protein